MAGEKDCDSVGDYITLQRGTTYKGSLVGEPGPALLGLGSIEPGGGFRHDHYKTYGGDCPSKLMLFPGDLYVALKGATKDGDMIGSVARVPGTVSSGRLTQDTVRLVFQDTSPDDQAYLYWVLRTPQYRSYCGGHATGSAVVALSRRDFLAFPVPPLTHWRKEIVALLDALEDKIESIYRTIKLADQLGGEVFQRDFVNLDHLPDGWADGTLHDLLVLQRGFDLPSTQRTPGDFPVLAASGPNGTHDKFMAKGPGVTTGRSGVLGRVFYVESNFWPLNTSLWVKEFRRASPAFAFYVLRHLNLAHYNSGSAVPTLNRNHIHNLPMMVPSKQAIKDFDSVVSPLMDLAEACRRQRSTLAAFRDALLPALISGPILVAGAGATVAAAS